MKTTKVLRKIEILSTFLSLGLIISLLSGCDVLESDPDVLQPSVQVMGDEICVLANILLKEKLKCQDLAHYYEKFA